jgi:hypothetical protein
MSPQTLSMLTRPQRVVARWEVRNGRLRLRWIPGPGAPAGRHAGGATPGQANAFAPPGDGEAGD